MIRLPLLGLTLILAALLLIALSPKRTARRLDGAWFV